jgi:hypothetical protein
MAILRGTTRSALDETMIPPLLSKVNRSMLDVSIQWHTVQEQLAEKGLGVRRTQRQSRFPRRKSLTVWANSYTELSVLC